MQAKKYPKAVIQFQKAVQYHQATHQGATRDARVLVLTRFPPETRGYSADVWSSAAFARRKFISAPECLWMLSYNNATGASPSAANDTVGGYMNMEAQLPQRHTHLRRQKVAIVEGVDKNIPYSVFFFFFRAHHTHQAATVAKCQCVQQWLICTFPSGKHPVGDIGSIRVEKSFSASPLGFFVIWHNLFSNELARLQSRRLVGPSWHIGLITMGHSSTPSVICYEVGVIQWGCLL